MKDIRMSKREVDMISMFDCILKGEISQKKAAEILGLTPRQVRRRQRRYEAFGALGLAHKNRGKTSNRRIPSEVEAAALDLLRTIYRGFGPTLAAEKLEKNHEIVMSKESVRKLMKGSGLWISREKRKIERLWRERKHHFGELIQIDGSYHRWFNNEFSTLIAFIDDATSIVELYFADHETTESLATITQSYLKKYGRPVALYADCGKVYKVNMYKYEQPRQTQFVRMLGELDIRMINAHSPQAKGRVERLFKTLQDRLVKELALLNIKTIDEANSYLRESFIAELNEKISIPAKNELDLHRSIENYDLKAIFSYKEKRKLNNDRTICYLGRWFLLNKLQPFKLYVGCSITVCSNFDGAVSLMANGHRLDFKEIEKPVKQAKTKEKKQQNTNSRPIIKPAENHPWKLEGKSNFLKLQKSGHF